MSMNTKPGHDGRHPERGMGFVVGMGGRMLAVYDIMGYEPVMPFSW